MKTITLTVAACVAVVAGSIVFAATRAPKVEAPVFELPFGGCTR